MLNSYSTGVIGESREIEGKTYVVPYSRESDGFPKLDKNGRQYRTKFLNERDNSNEIIVYSDLMTLQQNIAEKKGTFDFERRQHNWGNGEIM